MDDNDRNFGVRMYWDRNTIGLSNPSYASTFADRITSALKIFDEKYFLRRIVGYGDFVEDGGIEMFRHKDIDINLTHLPKRLAFCDRCKSDYAHQTEVDLPEHRLKQDMFADTFDNRPPLTILVVTSDAGFVPRMAKLKRMGCRILLACMSDADDALKRAADIIWLWEDMLKGKGPVGH